MDKQPTKPGRGANNNRSGRPDNKNSNQQINGNGVSPRVSRGAAIRAQKRTADMAQKLVNEYASAENKRLQPRANVIVDDSNKLKLTFLGGLDDVGEKNTAIFEYQNDAIVVDCGNNLGVDLPGINYEIADPSYLETIRHKIKGYVVTHGHLDHIGGLKHIVPMFPAPIYGSRFSLGIVEKSFEDVPAGAEHFTPKMVIMNMDGHERLKIGVFMVELIRITHSIPDATSVCIDTPVGRVIVTGDFRLDPEPLDHLPSDTERLKQLGDEGVLALLTESSYADSEGRTPTEHTLLQSFHDVIKQSHGRIFCAVFSSNMNRIQMIIDAAIEGGRKVAFDGRSMMSYAEIAVRQGILKVPKGTMVAMRDIAVIPDEKVLVMCTGGQGEPGAALQRMSEGEHKHVKLKVGDTVVISSSPIPGNEIRYDMISNNLAKMDLHLFRHPTYELDGCGPLHVSGHARRDEMRDMLKLVRPKFVIPVHAGMLRRKYHAELAIQEGWSRDHVILGNNGDSFVMTTDRIEPAGQVPHGSLLVDQTGAIVSNIVIKDRLMLAEEGLVAVVLTLDKKTGQLVTSPDIITRGFIYIRDSEELMNNFRIELRRAVGQRYKRIDLDRFKAELKDHVTHFLFEQTGRSPIVIPVVNVVGGGRPASDKQPRKPDQNNQAQASQEPSPEEVAADQQRRFQELRAKLLGQDARAD